ncbi:MAG: DUF262 domain-containing protein [Acidobacteria bacterium]|nr:DUF262 domain-containing protein [Acidobacteriota bacterium]MYH31613.1 DUF262 domain-containing protein [Acidobacteriota bacterium]MYK89893.1 DUF262 domain-containing protein [Acidobacteriota bacterium]
MTRANILNTGTASYLELIGNGKTYRVPPYQRDYAWTQQEWEDLWNDVVEMRGDPEGRHYMGALVVQTHGDREFLVIDGQQRLATISLLALAVIQKLRRMADGGADQERNRERAAGLRNRFIGEKDPASLVESSRLHLNETDDSFYQDYLVQLEAPRNPRGLPQSSALLWKCHRYFCRQIDQLFGDARGNGEEIAQILSETVARRLLFILITVDDELNAYTLFETLNARGLELTATDLLRNYFFSKVRTQSDIDSLKRRWQTLIATVTQEDFPHFLRFHLLREEPHIRRKRLFKLVRDRVRTPADTFAFVKALEAHAELFAALADVNHGYWMDLPAAKPFVQELNLFGARQMTPVFFAAWRRFSDDDFVRLLKLASVMVFRYSIVSALNPNLLERVSHLAAKAVLDGRATRPGAVFALLRTTYVDDDRFESDFGRWTVGTRGKRKKLARYVLARLETHAGNRRVDPETDPATVEHVLPENPAGEWPEAFPADRWDAAVPRLGNLTLLERTLNRSVGNAAYPAKRAAYETSAYALAREIADMAPEEWTPALLEERQRRLAARAVRLWRSDFT